MDLKAVGQRIKSAREAKNLTQEELAALVNLSSTHVSVIERGLKVTKLDTFVAIANALDVSADSRIIINLASKEYSKCIEKYLTPQDRYITIVFCELSGNKLVTKGTYAKMARGEMVRFIAEKNIENPVEIQKFGRLGYLFRSDLSSDSEYVFERKIK